MSAASACRTAALVLLLAMAGCDKAAPVALPAAAFDWFEYAGRDTGFERPAEQGEFRNPVLAGFYPDPSITRVGDEYFLVNSSFAWYPGVPIFRSTDLVNWHQVGYVLDREELLPLEGLGVSRGVFAPTIRYHDGLFYMITTLVDAGGNFYVTATDPAGPWSDPVWLPGIDGIDPSLFFDNDGRTYVLNNGPPDYEPLYDGHRAIWIQELDLETGTLVGPREVIVDGGVDPSSKPIWIEGPHVFKVDGWYYLIAAEGGTGFDHSEVVFRSREVFGPYEPGPLNPILTQRDLDPGRPLPVIATGHADFVQTPAGDWWSVFLGCRPYEGHLYNTGRETFLHPVTWQDGWPLILEPARPVPLVAPAPDLPRSGPAALPTTGNFTWRDDFESPALALPWNTLRGPGDAWLDLERRPGKAVIEPVDERLTGTSTPAYLARRQQHAAFTASTSMEMPQAYGMSAGLAVFQNARHHLYMGVRRHEAGWAVFLERVAGKEAGIIAEELLPAGDVQFIELRVRADGRPYAFSYRLDEGEWATLAGGIDGSILSTEVAGGFVGSYLGLHARRE
ncbi:MAG: glycoside hydrolase family 43 protein [Woeseiaceae bacterium]